MALNKKNADSLLSEFRFMILLKKISQKQSMCLFHRKETECLYIIQRHP